MQTRLLAALAVPLLISGSLVRADDARAILEKAIEAHGGAAKLAKLTRMRSKAKGTVHLSSDIPFTLETVWQEPDRLKNVLTIETAVPSVLLSTIAGGDSWSSRDGKPGPLVGVKRDELRAQAHVRRLLRLTPLLHDNTYEISPLGQIHIHDHPASGVRVVCPGERDVKLYFDAGTGRLAKIERHVYDADAKKEVRQEEFLSDYQDSDGVPTARKQARHRDGKLVREWTLTEVYYPDRLDAALFADPHPYTRRRDVIYGRKLGVALTMDVFTPKKGANGAALAVMVSGGWVSNPASIDTDFVFLDYLTEPVKRGFTVFTVCHGSQPLFTIPDAITDVNRAIRYIRCHARDYRIDPRRIGVTGASAGGHLSLMLGVASDGGDPHATDAVERTSSRVQAVACFVPPTDFLNYGAKGVNAFAADGVLANLKIRPAIDVREYDKSTKRLERLNAQEMEAICRRISPIEHVSGDDPPTLIIHGEVDRLVPVQQAEAMVAQLKKAGVPAKLIVKKGADHIWGGMSKDMVTIVDWFDKYLKKP